MNFVSNKEAIAMSLANSYVNDYSLNELKQYAFDRMVDELLDEPESVLEAKLVKLAEMKGELDEA